MTPETKHLLNVLRSAIRVLGYTFNDIAGKLGVGSGYLSRLFAGKIELKFDHVVEISRAIGFEPEEILHLAYPLVKQPPSLAAQQYQALVSGGERASHLLVGPGTPEDEVDAAVMRAFQRILTPVVASATAPSEEDIERVVEKVVQRFFARLGGQAQSQGG